MSEREKVRIISYEKFLEDPKSFVDSKDKRDIVLIDKEGKRRGFLGQV